MRPILLAAATVALLMPCVAYADGGRDPATGGDPTSQRLMPGGSSIEPSTATPSYPGPAVDTWLNNRFPPPAPTDFDLTSAGDGVGRPQMSVMAILLAVSERAAHDDFDHCVETATGDDFADILGACFCLTVDPDLAPGCAADGY